MPNLTRHALFLTALAIASPAGAAAPSQTAQPAPDHPHHAAMQHSAPNPSMPYSGLERREIKALSTEQIDQLLGGHGMGLALAAELNHYPGPRHVLELAGPLALSPDTKAKIEALSAAMSAEASRLGEGIVEQERALDRRFASGRIDLNELRSLTREIARLQGELRAAHLGAHLAVRALLTAGQTQRYDQLRGYAGGSTPEAIEPRPPIR